MPMCRRWCLIIFLGSLFLELIGQTNINIKGEVRSAYTSGAIALATIVYTSQDGHVWEAITDSTGRFEILQIVPGRYNITIKGEGYRTNEIARYLIGRTNILQKFELTPASTDLPELVITEQRSGLFIHPLSNALLVTREETEKLPAGFFDPARLFTSQSGVTSMNDGANHLVIRGNNPAFVKWMIHGTEILNPNHLSNAGTFSDQASPSGGGVNMVSASVLDNTYLYKAPYSAMQGNALAGAIDLNLRNGNIEKLTTEAQISLLGMELGLEGPLSKNGASFITRYRYSTVGLLSQLGAQFGDENINYQDVMASASFPSKKKDLNFFFFTGNNMNDYTGKKDLAERTIPKEWSNILFKGNQTLGGILYEYRINAHHRLMTDLVYSQLKNKHYTELIDRPSTSSENQLYERKWNLHPRWIAVLNDNQVWTTGFQLQANKDTYNYLAGGIPTEFACCNDQDNTTLQPYSNLLIESGRLSVQTGLHAMVAHETSIDPRAQISYKLGAQHSIQFSAGKYSQIATPFAYYLSNNNLLMRSLQAQLSIQGEKKNTQWSIEGYYQYHYNVPGAANTLSLINEAPAPQLFVTGDESTGKVVGMEGNLSGNLGLWRYTANLALFHATYESVAGNTYNSRFDQKYLVHTSIGREWEKQKTKFKKLFGWYTAFQAGGALRDSPLLFFPAPIEPFSITRPGLFRADLRVYRRRFYKHLNTMLALDIQNLTNQQNFGSSYYDGYTGRVGYNYQLGILPNISFTIEY